MGSYSKIDLSIVALMVANLVPVAGVVWSGWDAASIILVYWSENFIIGFYSVLKLFLVKVDNPLGGWCKLFVIPFFCIHFGAFCAAHGLFIMVLLRLSKGLESVLPLGSEVESFFRGLDAPGPLAIPQLLALAIARLWHSRPEGSEWLAASLLVSHGVSFVQNFVLKSQYRSLTTTTLMIQPYQRVMLLHTAILVGGVPMVVLGSPMPMLLALVGLKIVTDVPLHVRSHRITSTARDRANEIPEVD